MTLRARLVGAMSLVTLLSLAAALLVAGERINSSQERQFDDALRREAWQELQEIARDGGQRLQISPRLGPSPDDVGPLTKYAALYGPDGAVLDATESWVVRAPERDEVPDGIADFHHSGLHLRGLLSNVPGHPGTLLLLAAPRTDLDGDAQYLRRTMAVAFAAAMFVTIVFTSAAVRRLTTVHDRVARVARRVAAEDLDARIGAVDGAPEIVQLASDVDAMIDRIAGLLRNQSDFIAHASHELRSPLTSLYGELTNTARRERSVEEYRRTIDEALHATRRLMTLADDLLALARANRGPLDAPRRVDLGELVDETLMVLSHEAHRRGIRLDAAEIDDAVEGRALDLARMLRNLVENAVAHAPDGSTVEIRSSREGALVRISVRDYGPGVSPTDAPHVFQPFFRGSRERASERPGTGLGLAIASEIARQHPQGRIELVSVDGPGACFVVTLAAANALESEGA